MPVVPNGLPAWTRTASFEQYGGDVDKRNFASRGAINPKTDVGAEAFSRMVADLAAVARTAPFLVARVRCNDSFSPGPPSIEWCAMMTGIRAVSYVGNSPPAGFPAFARNGDGDITITLAASYVDPYGVAGAVSIQQATAQLNGSLAGTATGEPLTATTARFRAFVAAGTAKQDARMTITIGCGQ